MYSRTELQPLTLCSLFLLPSPPLLALVSSPRTSNCPPLSCSSDNEPFTVEKDVANRSVLIKNMIEGECLNLWLYYLSRRERGRHSNARLACLSCELTICSPLLPYRCRRVG